MTREKFIRKWLGNKDYQYTVESRNLMRDDLDEVINQALPQAHVIKSGCETKLTDETANNVKANVCRNVPYQLCPKCLGDGDLLRYNSPALMATNARPICDVCEGKRIIPMAHFG